MWVTFGHLRPSGHIMPDRGGDRAAAHLDPGASRSPPYQTRIGCARVVVWGWPAPGGGAGLREVDGRYLRGSSQVDRGHEPCWQIATWMARHVGCAHKLPAVSRGVPRCPAVPSSRESGLPADSGRTARTGPAV